ncbi:conserved hypothetical protein [Deferribacter desulfuricans SSM1]|uniref:YjgP/YjgQ family permease n=1 Tax=Deferribacter desulfuricans (strain DSM 14783 / JCM 11476 / NBRC 101012 / SSM1) TaxID=639282 RepID=D3PBY9_DEFDS|nr:LptF/LptG family permease [Deferribacter desulfuricans]BAI80112.1 conserved hypothetical protein [Deferribacter desulfuricans SSM1]
MRITEKYVLKELVPVFLVGNLFFIFILLIDKIVDLSELILAKNVPFFFVAELIIAYIPSFLVITIPTSTLLSALIVYGRLSDDSELVAMKSLGADKYNIFKPSILLGFISLVLALLMSLYLMPKGNDFAIERLMQISKYVSINDFKENELYTEIPGFVLYTDKRVDKNKFLGLIIINKKDHIVIQAKKGEIVNTTEGSLVFNLDNGVLIDTKGEIPSKLEFKSFVVNVPIITEKKFDVRNERLMSIRNLINHLNKSNIIKFELSKRFALPFASIIMAIFGAVVGSFFHRGGKAFGLSVSIIIVLIYNTLLLLSQNLINMLNPYLAAWVANIIFIILLVYLLRRA